MPIALSECMWSELLSLNIAAWHIVGGASDDISSITYPRTGVWHRTLLTAVEDILLQEHIRTGG